MPYPTFFSSFDYENSKGKKPKTKLERHEYVQRAGDWNRWSGQSPSSGAPASIRAVCPVYIKIDQKQHSQDWSKFIGVTDSTKVLRNEEGDLFVRMDDLLGRPFYPDFVNEITAGAQPPDVFLKPLEDFFKKYVLWKLSAENQDKMSKDMIKHFHQGGICTVANLGLSAYMRGQSISFAEAKQKMLFEPTEGGFKFSERNKYYEIVDPITGQKKESERSFLSTQVDMDVKIDGIQIDKVVISAKSEVVEQFPEIKDIEVGLFQKIWDMIRGFFGAKNTAEITPNQFIPFSTMEEKANQSQPSANEENANQSQQNDTPRPGA